MSQRFFRTTLAAFPLLLSLHSALPAMAADQLSAKTKVFRPKGVRIKPKAATGVAIVNAASYLPGVSPGGIASIFGVGLSVINDIESAPSVPLPFQIADVTVYVDNIPAPLFVVAYQNGGDQINFQVPYETPVGLVADGTGVPVDVYSNGVLVSSTLVDSFTEDPGIFIYVQNSIEYAIAVHYPDYSLVSPSDPAIPGEFIILYVTGLGPLTAPVQDGFGAPSDPIAYTQDPYNAQINGETCSTTPLTAGACLLAFSGLAPGLVGLDQLNIQLPTDLPAGDLPLQIFTQYSNSGIAYLSVQ